MDELIVRISWCWNKKSGPFPEKEGLCYAKARFDQAIDVQSGKIIGNGLYNWLEWQTPKKRFGHPYGFAFQEGHLYRLLVQEQKDAQDERTRSYHVVQLLESDVVEPRLDPFLQFAEGFDEEPVERWLLIEDDAFGWAEVFSYRRTSVRYLAIAQGTSDEPQPCAGRLWVMEKAHGPRLTTKFGNLSVCRALVREGKERDGQLLLVKLLQRMDDPRFSALREELQQPVVLTSTLGEFTLDRHYDWYEGTIDYLGELCNVLLNVEEGETDATAQLRRLEEICDDLPGVDRSLREYAAQTLLEDAADWCEEELTREEFMERMSSPSITVNTDGSVDFMFDDGGMFAGHVIAVYLDADGSPIEADIAG